MSAFAHSRFPIPNSPIFAFPIRIYWEDTDAGGVVYHARYLHFLERARTEWLRAAGIGQSELRERENVVFVVHALEIRFNAPARLDDLLTATVQPIERRSASFVVAQTLKREPEARALVEARVRVACLDATGFRPRPIPEHLLDVIASS
ncbi:MAG TPA: tol-pal system-associated acyl-CoA thioesterase [Rhodanobacteraceae bacterium]|nr:tol-pal system-associated acyl-CoA thioesterase [Rhodanobacteraceae bacterium]